MEAQGRRGALIVSRNIDLKKLPARTRYPIALTLAAIVATAAWFVGRDRPLPSWIDTGLVPALGWLYLVLVIIVLASRLRRR